MVSEVFAEGGGMTAQVQTLQLRVPGTKEWFDVPSDPELIARHLDEPVYVIKQAIIEFVKCGMARYVEVDKS